MNLKASKLKKYVERLKLNFEQENFCIKILVSHHYFSPLSPWLWLTDQNADSGGPKTYGSGSGTLEKTAEFWHYDQGYEKPFHFNYF